MTVDKYKFTYNSEDILLTLEQKLFNGSHDYQGDA